MTVDKSGGDYSPVSQHGIDVTPIRQQNTRTPFFRRRSWIMTWGIGVLIATIVAIVIASVVINVIGSSSSSRLNGKCLTFNDDQDRMDYKVAKSTNLFDTRLFHSVASASPDNLVLSSHSVAAVLSLALLGAKGQTAQELGGVLALPCSSDEENTTAVENVYFSAYKVAHASLQGDSNVKLESANTMFVEKKFNLNREFESNANDYFSSKPQKVDFSQNHDLARQEINNWVEGKTNEKIKDLLPSGSVSPNTKIVLVNAIYFKGKWFNQFNADATNKSGQFILNSGESVIHPMMNLEAKLQSAKLGNVAQLIKLPYEGQRLAMYILVPLEDATINEVQEYVTNIEADDLTSVLQAPVLTNLIMPKFKIESTYNLKSTLVSMGLASLFDESKADLTGLNEYEEDKSMFVDDVIQKAFVEVNEEGTEAAAATGLIMKANSFQFPDHYYELNKPFLFYIRDEETGLNLFSGRLMDPRS